MIKPGKNGGEYWKNSDLVLQLQQRVIPIFKTMHPGDDALFMFDNSQNHHALPPDALNAKVLPLKNNGSNFKAQRDGWLINSEGDVQIQKMTNEYGHSLEHLHRTRSLTQNHYLFVLKLRVSAPPGLRMIFDSVFFLTGPGV